MFTFYAGIQYKSNYSEARSCPNLGIAPTFRSALAGLKASATSEIGTLPQPHSPGRMRGRGKRGRRIHCSCVCAARAASANRGPNVMRGYPRYNATGDELVVDLSLLLLNEETGAVVPHQVKIPPANSRT
jgi:hypothetical protein